MRTRYFVALLGIAFLSIGVLGMLPQMLSTHPGQLPAIAFPVLYGYLFNLFPVNLTSSLIHIFLGGTGLWASRESWPAHSYAKVVGVFLLLLALFGLIPGWDTLFGWMPVFGNDVWLHAVLGLLAVYFGFFVPIGFRENTPHPLF